MICGKLVSASHRDCVGSIQVGCAKPGQLPVASPTVLTRMAAMVEAGGKRKWEAVKCEDEEDENEAVKRAATLDRGVEYGEVDTAEQDLQAASYSAEAASTRFVRLRGLPFSAGEPEIQGFLEGLDIAEIRMRPWQNGHPTGEAYVAFISPEMASAALERNRTYLGHRYVEVFLSTEDEFNRVAQSTLQLPQGSHVLKLRGLPWASTEEDVVTFLAEYEVSSSQVVMGVDPTGRASGEAFVTLSSEELVQRVMVEKQHQSIGNRYVEIFVSSQAELSGVHNVAASRQAMDAQESRDLVVRMRGLPYQASEEDVLGFWNGYSVVQVALAGVGPGGRPSGEAFVEFSTPEERARAIATKQHSLMGSRYIELFVATPQEDAALLHAGRQQYPGVHWA